MECSLQKKRGGISLAWLLNKYSKFPKRASKDMVDGHTKAYIFRLCGTTLFPIKSKNIVHPRYMQFIANIGDVAICAWSARPAC